MNQREIREFGEWLQGIYGWRDAYRIVQSLENSIRFKRGEEISATLETNQYWQAYQRVLAEEERVAVSPTAEELAAFPKEKYVEFRQKELLGATRPSYAAREGSKWKRREVDPETGFPLREEDKFWEQVPIEDEEGLATPNIEVINGFNVIVRRDGDGNIINMQVISPVDEGGPTAFQEMQFDLRKEELAFERQRTIEDEKERQAAAFGRRVATPQDFSEKIRQIQSLAFEDAKAELLFNIGEGPRNQFIRARLNLEINPFIKPPRLTPSEEMAGLDAEEKRYRKMLEDTKAREDLSDPVIQSQVSTLTSILRNLGEQRVEVSRGILAPFEEGAELTGTSPGAFRATAIRFAQNPNSQEFANLSSEENIALFGAGESAGFFDEAAPAKEKTGIAPPSIIQQFVPELKGQKFIPGTGTTPGTIPKFPAALSGQQFGRLTPTQLETIRGFQEFAGQLPVDFEFQTAATIPKRPTLGKRQRPAFQVA